MKTNIILCGFMGCGKSTVGAELSRKLDTVFVDIDRYIEEKYGMRIAEIFERFGEDRFRLFEREACRELAGRSGIVIAAGGGTILDPVNVTALKATGRIVLLDAPLSEITRRLKNDHSRPLLNRPDKARAIQQLFVARMPLYIDAADLVVKAGSKLPGQIADLILAGLKNRPE